MNRRQLQVAAERAGIRRGAYHLPGEDDRLRIIHDCYALDIVEGGWAVFYSERGERVGEQQFDTEDEACAHLLLRLTEDPGTRTVGTLIHPRGDRATTP